MLNIIYGYHLPISCLFKSWLPFVLYYMEYVFLLVKFLWRYRIALSSMFVPWTWRTWQTSSSNSCQYWEAMNIYDNMTFDHNRLIKQKESWRRLQVSFFWVKIVFVFLFNFHKWRVWWIWKILAFLQSDMQILSILLMVTKNLKFL